uniref:DUF7656 domain-containing protein n=1 Tax=Acrobeloides nanus TaxID=290746 RepID=A0A914CTI9_9BILA
MQTEFYLKYNAEISQPSSVASILARYGSKMKFASTNFVQQSDVFHSGDQKSFLNKSDYINYLTQERNVPCLEKNINFEEFIRSIDDGYVFLCCWNEVISNINEDDAFNENYDGELQYFDELLNDQKTCLFVDQDLMLNPIFPNQCRICQIKNGKICVEDLLNRYQA